MHNDDDFGTIISLDGLENLHLILDSMLPMPEDADNEDREPDTTRVAPTPTPDMYPPTLNDIIKACCECSEAVPVAVAINILIRFSALVGPMVYLPIGDEKRLLNEFVLMVGPTGLGKGSSNHGPDRIFKQVESYLELDLQNQFQAGKSEGINQYSHLKIHSGGLSSGEGLAAELDDGSDKSQAVTDKRIIVFESEFSNTMSMHQRSGNTVSMVLRNAFDGVDIKPLTKRDKVRVTRPYVCLFANITASELTTHEQSKTLTHNGMLNRFLILWQQPVKEVPFPEPMPSDKVEHYASLIAQRIMLSRNYSHETHWKKTTALARPLSLNDDAKSLWKKEYGRLLNRPDCDVVMTLTRRHRLHALILSSLFALLDGRLTIQPADIRSALSWCEYSRKSVVYIFNVMAKQATAQQLHGLSRKVLYAIAVLNKKNHQCTASDLYNWFQRKLKKELLHGSLELLLNHIPPLISQSKVIKGRGRPMYLYNLTEASMCLSEKGGV